MTVVARPLYRALMVAVWWPPFLQVLQEEARCDYSAPPPAPAAAPAQPTVTLSRDRLPSIRAIHRR